MRRLVRAGAIAVTSLVLSGLAAPVALAGPAGPGALSHFGLARKDCLGTARNTTSKVWFTVAGGVLSDVYAPAIDNTNVESLQFVVTDGRTFTDLQSRDTTYTVRSAGAGGMACEVTSTARNGRYRLITEYHTDPARDSVLLRTRLEPLTGSGADLKVFVRFDANINGNGGGGPVNGGADDATVDAATTALVSSDPETRSSAPSRDYGTPLAAALRADRKFLATVSGFAGTPTDGLTQLDKHRRLTYRHPSADDGNVVQTAQLDLKPNQPATLSLGFGQTARAAIDTAGASLATPFDESKKAYAQGWDDYDRRLKPLRSGDTAAYKYSANVLKASEDKTFPGAIVASLGSPWGQAVSAGDAPGGLPVYFGSYREIFARDLYESFSGLMAAGDLDTAKASVRWLFERQQQPDGRFPRNSLLNGKKAPDSGGDQLDETAYPILMALQSGADSGLYDHIRRAADFLVARGPSFGSERWEEQSGHSPSTIAAQIAGLVAAGTIAGRHGDPARARLYLATADHFQRSVKAWTVTTTGPYGDGRYFLRLSKNGDPDSGVSYNLGNGSITVDQREVVDAGFLELPRLGILPASDPDVARSLAVADPILKRDTPRGPGWYRYGTAAEGSEDGYGDCYEPDPTNCGPTGRPWPGPNTGSGHLWPVLAGERGEHLVQTGDRQGATALLTAMRGQATGSGLIPEQIWENAPVPPSPSGTDPAIASIGFETGGAAGSASPLSWAQSESIRLARSIDVGRLVEQPAEVRGRYVDRTPPAAVPVTLSAPDSVSAPNATVTGTAPPGTTVDVAASPTDTGGATTVFTTTADAGGRFQAEVPTPLGTTVVTAAASGAGTGHAQRVISSDFVSGTVLLDVTDPEGDDHGPGTFTYPTAGDFHDGAFDLRRFQVIDTGDQLVLRAGLRDLTPTFGSPLGAQLLTLYAHDPATPGATTAPFPSRNYAIAAEDAWSRRIEVQGFADPSFVGADGVSLGAASVQASQASRTITVSVPKSAFGAPGPGWKFAVVLSGQDGNSPDQARPFTTTAGPYTFGLCAAGGAGPVCAADPAAAPKVLDALTPAGVEQGVMLDFTRGPVLLRGVPLG
ncbi:glucodextranase DOMON-like domain-containing protein [Amycolatopsis sp. 195334CR]|uniref:glucodextranase DOMON-like domain-containing protein n=1 Tax=Amycolatopsis sp. 195334CR TaxID=2814588 RepID=UPI001A8E8F14|nr:glucodextranase DOMON-like domain-containing protein [Amycolatopsis sp. 195334CR]MBN6040548.1 glucan 1,4-alpha-glucosidase [Amycolatopsis sp. 195334CR]